MPAPVISDAQWDERIVSELRARGGLTIRELSQRWRSSALGRHVSRLSDSGVLHREALPGKGGGYRYYLREAVTEIDGPRTQTVSGIIERRYDEYDRVSAPRRHTVTLPDDLPIAIWHCGDPHLDDPGTDLRQLHTDQATVRATPGMYGGNVGDTTNNWVGKLARLHAQQETTAAESWVLAEDFLRRCQWLYLVSGNHDCWSGDSDPLRWIARLVGAPAPTLDSTLAITWRSIGVQTVRVRHSFPGRSQYNPAHGVAKAARASGCDLLVCGHTHECGHQTVGHEDGWVSHALQVGSYKRHDRYAEELGLAVGQAFAPSAVTIHDPEARLPVARVRVHWDVQEAAAELGWLRRRRSR